MTEVTRAFSKFEVKSFSEDERVITGMASTPHTDRHLDRVLPMGAQFLLPLPLLLDHDVTQPIGIVTEAMVTERGIHVVCQFGKADEPPQLKDALDLAWGKVRAGLIRGLSIGFRVIESEPIPGGGVLFKKWAWCELSATAVPANAHASILSVKAHGIEGHATAPTKSSEEIVVDALTLRVGDRLLEKFGIAKTTQALAEVITAVRMLQKESGATAKQTAAAADGIFTAVDAHVRRAVDKSQGDMVAYLTALESRVANIERKK